MRLSLVYSSAKCSNSTKTCTLPNSLWLSKWRLMLSVTKNDREMFTLASKFSDKLSAFPNKERGVLFSIRYYGFSPIRIVGKHFLLSTMYKSMLWSQEKSLRYWWYFSWTEMHFSVGIISFRLIFLQCIYIFIDSPWAYIFRVFLFTILIYGIKALVRTIPGRAHTFLSKKNYEIYVNIWLKKKTHHRFNSE